MKNRKSSARDSARNASAPRMPVAPADTPAGDTDAVIAHYGLRRAFPRQVLAEARAIAARARAEDAKNLEGRLDLRKKFIFTCDPVAARDYDDALSLEKDRLGRRVLGVHIADVSHYVAEGGAMDREAYKRSTSVYLATCVLPMLPPELSNDLCSLKPGEDRLAFSVFLTFNRDGEVVKRAFAKSVINSKARFTYEQVMAVIGAKKISHAKTAPGEAFALDRKAVKTIKAISELAQQLRERRFAAGALDLDIPENEVVLNDEGEMSGIVARVCDESHQMIEECMVAANEAVATELRANGVPIVSRFHDSPDPEKIQLLREELRPLGIKCGNIANPKVFSQFLRSIKTHPLYPVLAVMVLRSMKRAVYDARNTGHWGLAKKYYAHFTSPIRRYPDLSLHRLLFAYLEGKRVKGAKPASLCRASARHSLEELARHATEREELAAEAERSLLEIKKYRILEEELVSHMPVVYDAVVVRCERFGCFVDIPVIGVSGLVHVSSLSGRFVRYNEYDHTLSAPGAGSWKIGDVIKVVVSSVDYAQRRLLFVPAP